MKAGLPGSRLIGDDLKSYIGFVTYSEIQILIEFIILAGTILFSNMFLECSSFK